MENKIIKRDLIIEKKYITGRGMSYIIKSIIRDEFKKQVAEKEKEIDKILFNLLNSK